MVRFWGTTIQETIDAFSGPHLGDRGEQKNKSEISDKTKSIVRIVLTFILLILSIYLIIAGEEKDVGGTILGAICGYWLK